MNFILSFSVFEIQKLQKAKMKTRTKLQTKP